MVMYDFAKKPPLPPGSDAYGLLMYMNTFYILT